MIYLAADHRGFQLKESLKRFLTERGTSFEDVGAPTYAEGDDYVDFAAAAAQKIVVNPDTDRGIFLCGSGHGVDIVANKFRGVRAALCWDVDEARKSRNDDDANVLALAADESNEIQARDIVSAWLDTEFSGEDRHIRRLKKIGKIEEENFR